MADQHPPTYWTSDRSALVEEGDPRAAFLAYAPGDPISSLHLEMLHGKPAPEPEPEDEPENAALPTPKPRATKPRTSKGA